MDIRYIELAVRKNLTVVGRRFHFSSERLMRESCPKYESAQKRVRAPTRTYKSKDLVNTVHEQSELIECAPKTPLDLLEHSNVQLAQRD